MLKVRSLQSSEFLLPVLRIDVLSQLVHFVAPDCPRRRQDMFSFAIAIAKPLAPLVDV